MGCCRWLRSAGCPSTCEIARQLNREGDPERRAKDPNIVVEGLKRALSKRKELCLLCLKNADNRNTNGLLSAVCSIPVSLDKRENGWILVTSRQGQLRIWDKMKVDQRLFLGCLSEEDAMIVLWRQVKVIGTDKADDQAVLE